MRKTYLKTIAILGLFFMLAVGSANAQTGSMIEVKVPFDFTAGNAKLKAGSYTVRRVSRNTLLLRSADGKTSKMILAPMATSQIRKDTPERLVFHRYGNQYFLNEVWANRATDGLQLWPSTAESRLAKNKTDAGPQRVEIIARAK